MKAIFTLAFMGTLAASPLALTQDYGKTWCAYSFREEHQAERIETELFRLRLQQAADASAAREQAHDAQMDAKQAALNAWIMSIGK